MTDAAARWHPVATSLDLPDHHIFHGQLLGRELAIWRAEDGFVNVWENRCLHRGVRLTIGSSDGKELTCRYHGWRYANRSAGCTYIPAHPADAPPRTICNRTFPSVERYGLIWSGEQPLGEPAAIDVLEDGDPFALRCLPVNAPFDVVLEELSGHWWFWPTDVVAAGGPGVVDAEVSVTSAGEYTAVVEAAVGPARSTVVFFVQPVDSGQTVIRPVLAQAPDPAQHIAVWRHHATRLAELVERCEVVAAMQPAPEPIEPVLEQVSLALSVMPERSVDRQAPLRVRVARKWMTAQDVAAFQLESIGDPLPTFQPGAHIDVHLPNGLVRQYSITNGPGETAHYRIGVKREPESTGGSQALHDTVHEGDVLAISDPRNNFPLRRDAVRTLLIAGGIGITPMLAMAQALEPMGLDYELHCFARSEGHLAFDDVRAPLGERVVEHLGLSPAETTTALGRLLAEHGHAEQVYICGPAPMLEAARRIAAEAGWPNDAVHFEYFKNTNELDDSSEFEIALARSAVTLSVPAGETILDVLRSNGLAMPSSCEQGACGTCVVGVIEGDIDHQDVHLNDTERAAGDRIMTCVSRAHSARLVLDL